VALDAALVLAAAGRIDVGPMAAVTPVVALR
jgi:hypothetical protein